MGAAVVATLLLQQLSRSVCQIFGRLQARIIAGEGDVIGEREAHGIVQVNGLHNGCDLVIAVVAASEHFQREVNFGVRLQGQHAYQDSAGAKQRKGCPNRGG